MTRFLLSALLLGLISCKSTSATKENETPVISDKDSTAQETLLAKDIPVLGSDYQLFDLKKFGYNASVMAPKNAYIYESTIDDNEGARKYTVVQLSESNNKVLEIIPSKIGFADAVKTLESPTDMWYTRKRIYSDANSIVYVATSKVKGAAYNEIAYNFLTVVTIDGQMYHLKASSEQDFTKAEYAYTKQEVLNLFAMARSFKGNK